jgi:hypothetical protein
MPINDTCGLLFTHSSPSAGLQRSLENRLRERMDVNGCPEYALTWRESDMPSGLPICALRASGRRTLGSGSTGWQTPKAKTGKYQNGPGGKKFLNLEGEADLAGWQTPNCMDTIQPNRDLEQMEPKGHWGEEMNTGKLSEQTQKAGWPSPVSQEPGGTPEQHLERKRKCVERGIQMGCVVSALSLVAQTAGWPTPNCDDPNNATRDSGQFSSLTRTAQMAGWTTPAATEPDAPDRPSRAATGRTTEYLGRQARQAAWPTPSARDPKGGYEGGRIRKGKVSTDTLDVTAQLAGWATPQQFDSTDCPSGNLEERKAKGGCSNLREQAAEASGLTPSGTSAATASGAESQPRMVLNPLFSAWLMGFPVAWTIAGLSSMRLPGSPSPNPCGDGSCSSKATATP